MRRFEPKLEVLSPGQRDLWNSFHDVPEYFTLCGDAALALRLGHRPAESFEFHTGWDFTPDNLRQEIPWLKNATVQQEGYNKLTASVEREGEDVQVSFVGGRDIARVAEPDECSFGGPKIASTLDLAASKVIEMRDHSESHDYVDLAYMIGAGFPLLVILGAAAAISHCQYSPEEEIENLVRLGDGEEAKRFVAQEAAQIREVPSVPLQATVMTPWLESQVLAGEQQRDSAAVASASQAQAAPEAER